MNAPRVASAVKSTTITAPMSIDVPMMPQAVTRNGVPRELPPALISSPRVVLTESQTPMASSARYSTAVATIATMKSTTDTANENFMTDQGSIRLRFRRARRGPRDAGGDTAGGGARRAGGTAGGGGRRGRPRGRGPPGPGPRGGGTRRYRAYPGECRWRPP